MIKKYFATHEGVREEGREKCSRHHEPNKKEAR